jgi:Domain of unknown function (DUF5666)
MITLRTSGAVAVGAGLLLASLLSACGGGASHTNTATSPTTAANGSAGAGTGSGSGTGGGGTGTGGGSFPGASGSVAAMTGSSMEVQNQQSGQVTVSWTSSTTFTKTTVVSAANVVAGDCVTVTGSTSTGTLVASAVMVSKPTSSGSCTTGGFGAGGPGGGGGLRGGTPPNGGSVPNGGSLPNGSSGSATGRTSGFSFASGKVTSISPSSLVIYGISSSGLRGSRSSTESSTPPTSIKSTTVTIGLQGSTTYSETQSAGASALAVGDCVTAVGSSDTTGAVTARSVRITSTGGKTCSSGFGGFGGGGSANG